MVNGCTSIIIFISLFQLNVKQTPQFFLSDYQCEIIHSISPPFIWFPIWTHIHGEFGFPHRSDNYSGIGHSQAWWSNQNGHFICFTDWTEQTEISLWFVLRWWCQTSITKQTRFWTSFGWKSGLSPVVIFLLLLTADSVWWFRCFSYRDPWFHMWTLLKAHSTVNITVLFQRKMKNSWLKLQSTERMISLTIEVITIKLLQPPYLSERTIVETNHPMRSWMKSHMGSCGFIPSV